MKQGWVMMKKICFKDYGLEIDVDGFINIIGSRNSGKTYLLKTMINQKNSNNVFIDDKAVSDYDIDFLRNNVAAVLNNFIFNTDSVRESMQKLYDYASAGDDKFYKAASDNNSILKLISLIP